ncbi:choice-of-anchor M domain-containing protein [Streptomyces litchfieldiae]|uniref:Choice-of-anchor M domain-containing protein n=1 Tax=Streptomyces litchfieldiae TaxID=3075543 RepID=A0ABU2MX63_9ACTN|nr:choice-of-anchor M domain-containing protein [Streptomyces sp. DSM 44938]MDT0346204.1 choice-of-anchor M domain-containing protein [Streptomyces sp. DSM 44938]
MRHAPRPRTCLTSARPPAVAGRAATRLLLAAALTVALPATALAETTAPEDENAAGQPTVLDEGHVDIGPRFADGEWQIQGRDDTVTPPEWRALTDIVTQVSDAAVQQAPDDAQFDFLDAEPGSDVYVIPQTQAADVVWLGWNTQDPEVIERVNRGATLTLHGVEGPGAFAVFLQNGDLGAPEVLWDGDVTAPQDLWVDVNTHTHANWVFTEPGVYLLDFEISADLISGEHVSDRAALRFAVGEETDPADAFAATGPTAPQDAADETPAADPTTRSAPESSDDSSATPAVLLGAGAAALLLVAAITVTALRGRRARRLADDDTAGRTS